MLYCKFAYENTVEVYKVDSLKYETTDADSNGNSTITITVNGRDFSIRYVGNVYSIDAILNTLSNGFTYASGRENYVIDLTEYFELVDMNYVNGWFYDCMEDDM